MSGGSISHFEILEPLGEGGMGVVSLARDTRLGRLVALKVLHPESCCDPEQKQRFLQEARTASSLNHPNIVTIYEIDNADGVDLIAMEYVRGQTIDRIVRGRPLDAAQAADYAIQMARALEAAHGAGIAHRDIKPSNIMVNDAGLVKVLDFGLAKIRARGAPFDMSGGGQVSELTTASGPRTAEGVLMGTLAYMSPEQVSARPAAFESDIFSFGTVFYEMLSGANPFHGSSNAETVTAILRDSARPLAGKIPGVTTELDAVVSRCHEKTAEKRYPSATALRVALEEAAAVRHTPSRFRFPNAAVAAFAALVLAAVGLLWWRTFHKAGADGPEPAPAPMVRLTADPGLTSFPAISRDGTLVAYASDRAGAGDLDVWVQQTSGGNPIRLTTVATDDYEPVFSPDGAYIAYRSERDGGGIYVMPALGGDSRLVAPKGRSPAWSPDGKWIAYIESSAGVGATFSTGPSRLYAVPSSGGDPTRLAPGYPVAHHPQWSPDSSHVIFIGNDQLGPPTYDLCAVTLEPGAAPIRSGAFESLRTRGLVLGPFPFALTPADGDVAVVFSARSGDSLNLWRVRLSPLNWRVSGPFQQVTHGTGREIEASIAQDGRMVFSSGQQNSDLYELPVNANTGAVTGKLVQLTREAGDDYYPDIAADGSAIAFVSRRSGNDDVFLYDARTGRHGALLVTLGREMYPKVSADGTVVAFTSIAEGRRSILYMPATGGVATKLCEDCGLLRDMTPDGGRLLLQVNDPPHVSLMDVATRKVTPFIQHARFPIYAPKVSADGGWVAFQVVDRPTARTIYVARMSNPRDWTPVTDGKSMDRSPAWSPDGRLLYYLSERDTFRCIWAQRLDAAKRPAGAPFAVAHFHDAVRSMMNLDGPAQVSISVGPDRLVFSMGVSVANVWLARLP
ncbi:MAG: protein kinase [Bryobacteraceae bacterium]